MLTIITVLCVAVSLVAGNPNGGYQKSYSPAPAYMAPSYAAPAAPSYRPTYSAPAPSVYKAKPMTYAAPAPTYQQPMKGYSVQAPMAYKAESYSTYSAPAPTYKAPATYSRPSY